MDASYHPNCQRCKLNEAAPDLLEACKKAAWYLNGPRAKENKIVQQLNIAIAKAENVD